MNLRLINIVETRDIRKCCKLVESINLKNIKNNIDLKDIC